MSFSGKSFEINENNFLGKEFLSCSNTRKNSFDSMNLPEILNAIDSKNQPLTSTNKQRFNSQSRKKPYNHFNRRTNTVMGDRQRTTEDTIDTFDFNNYNHLKTVGEDEIESKLSKEINNNFDQQVYINTIKLNGQKNGRSSTLPASEEQIKNLSQYAAQQTNINTHFNKFFKKKLRITSTTPGKQNGTSSRSTRQNSQQSSPISLQQRDIGTANNFIILSRRSTVRQGVSPDNEQKLLAANKFQDQQQEYFQSKRLNEFLKQENSQLNKSSQKYEGDVISPAIQHKQNDIFANTDANLNMAHFDRFSSSKIKRKFKGANGLTPQILELWINDTLIEAQSDKFAQSQLNEYKQKPNTSLNGFSLERKNLISKGVKNEGIDRIYRSLFVYSFGFYEMLYEVLEHLKDKDTIISQIWRVYGILLEYCARGDFSTTVNIIEKNKEEIVESLNKVIAEKSNQIKQYQIEEQNQSEKHHQEIRNLTQENESLQNEKARLLEDNKILDSQFNSEAKMRLQFEHKINELYSIYRELNTKHQRLLTEKDSIEDDLRNLKRDYATRNEEKQNYFSKYTQAAKEVEDQKASNSRLTEKVKSLEDQLVEINAKIEIINSQNKELNEDNQKKQLKINELSFQFDNLKSQNRQYIENNKRVEEKKSEMMNEKEYYEQRIRMIQKQLNETQIKLNLKENEYAEMIYKVEYDQGKLKELTQELKEKTSETHNLQKQLKGVQIDLELSQSTLKNQEIDLQNLEKCVREYKLGQAEAEAQLNKATKQINQLYIQLDASSLETKKWINQFENMDLKYQQLQNEYRIHKDNCSNQIINLKSKNTKYEQENKKQANDLAILTKQVNFIEREKEDLQNELFDLQRKYLALKDVNQEYTFQNTSIESSLIDKEKMIEELKNQNIQILQNFTDYKIKLEQTQRELLSLTGQHEEYKNQTQENIQSLHNRYSKELSQYKNIEAKVHAMEHEDAVGQIYRYKDVVRTLEEKIKEKESSILFVRQQREATEENRRAVEKSKSELVSKLSKLQAQYDSSLVDIQLFKQQIEQQKNATISQQESLTKHFSKEVQETKQNYEEQIQKLSDTLNKQVKELEGQLKYTMQKNIALKDENEKLQEINNQLEEEIDTLKNQQIQPPPSPTKSQNTIQSRPNSRVSKFRESEPSSPLRTPLSPLRSPVLKTQTSIESGSRIKNELINKLQPLLIDQEVQTSFTLIPQMQVNSGETKLQVLQNITNFKQHDDSQQVMEFYNKARQLQQDSLSTNIQASILDKNVTEDREQRRKKKQLQIIDPSQMNSINADSNTQNNTSSNTRPQTVDQKSRHIAVHQRNISTAYEKLKPTDRYPTDKFVKKQNINNQELAKILNIQIPQQAAVKK